MTIDDFHPGVTDTLATGALADSIQAWAEGARSTDLFDVLLALGRAGSADPRQAGIDRGFALLMLGRPRDALHELAQVLPVPAPPSAPVDAGTLTVDACLAATGDDAAYRRLLSFHGSEHWLPAYLTGAVAEARGDHDLADQAWFRAVEVSGLSDHVYPRWAEAVIAGRDRLDAQSMLEVLCLVALQGRPDQRLRQGSAHAVAAVRRLERRDPVGAWLLAQAILRTQDGGDELEQLRDRLEPPGLRRYNVLSILASLLVVPFVVFGVVAIVVGAVGRTAWRRWIRVPGLTLPESRAWRGLSQVRFNQLSGRSDVDGGEGNALTVLGLITGFSLGLFLSLKTLDLLVWLTGVPNGYSMPGPVQVGVWFVGVIGTSALGFFGTRRARNSYLARRRLRERRSAEQAALNGWQRCQCLLESKIGGPAAGIYAQAHLRSFTVAAGSLPALPAGSALRSCPRTGILWLAVAAPGEKPVVLLRGAAPTAPSAVEAPGMYL